jgi:hypothetical protein
MLPNHGSLGYYRDMPQGPNNRIYAGIGACPQLIVSQIVKQRLAAEGTSGRDCRIAEEEGSARIHGVRPPYLPVARYSRL